MPSKKGYQQYRYDMVYSEPVDVPLDAVGHDVKCVYTARTTLAGEMLEIKVFPAYLNRSDYSRAKKWRPSSKQQQVLNERNARQKFIRYLNANFTTRDLWGTFGWDPAQMPASLDAARAEVRRFVERINYALKKQGDRLKYMYVIESEKGSPAKGEPETKYHVHMVMSKGLDRDQIESLWHGGAYPQTRRLRVQDFGGLTGLATYLTKQAGGKRRWGQSKGLRPWTKPPRDNRSKFSRSRVQKMVQAVSAGESLKNTFEKAYQGYAYRDAYPCEAWQNDCFGGYYLYCRMYRSSCSKKK